MLDAPSEVSRQRGASSTDQEHPEASVPVRVEIHGVSGCELGRVRVDFVLHTGCVRTRGVTSRRRQHEQEVQSAAGGKTDAERDQGLRGRVHGWRMRRSCIPDLLSSPPSRRSGSATNSRLVHCLVLKGKK